MELVLRAYDHDAVQRAESLPVQELLTVLERGGLRDAGKARVGLSAQEDIYARETVVSRLEGLVQEGYSEQSLAGLRAAEPPDTFPRRLHGAVIDAEEAVALREDLVRYLTYGLWRAPEETIAHALAVLTGQPDSAFLLGSPGATSGLQEVLNVVQDDAAFAERYSARVRAALGQAGNVRDDAALQRELTSYQQLLGPVSRLLHAAHQTGLRVIAYQDEPGGDGLTRFLAQDMEASTASDLPRVHGNGRVGGPE